MQKERNSTEDGGNAGHRTASSKLVALYQESLTSHTAQTVYILLAIKHSRFIILFKNNIPLSLVQKC